MRTTLDLLCAGDPVQDLVHAGQAGELCPKLPACFCSTEDWNPGSLTTEIQPQIYLFFNFFRLLISCLA